MPAVGGVERGGGNHQMLFMAEVMLRVPALLFLDVLMSGIWLIPFTSSIENEFFAGKQNMSIELVGTVSSGSYALSNLTFYDALFSSELLCWRLWLLMTWKTYILLSLFYYASILLTVGYLIADTNHIFELIEWAGPFILALSVFNWGLVDVRDGVHDWHSPKSLILAPATQKDIILVGTRLATRLAYAIVGSNLFIKARQDFIPSMGTMFGLAVNSGLRFAFLCPFAIDFTFRTLPLICAYFGILPASIPMPHILVSPFLLVALICAPVVFFESLIFVYLIPKAYRSLHKSFLAAKRTVTSFGVYFFTVTQWNRLQVPTLMRCFLITRMSVLLVYAALSSFDDRQVGPQLPPVWEVWHRVSHSIQYLLVRSCETAIAVIGASSMVSVVGQMVMTAFQSFLGLINAHRMHNAAHGVEEEDEPNAGALTAVLFLLLALQTGLTGLSPAKRLAKLHRNFWLLTMAMLHFVHFIVNKVLLRLSTTGTHRWSSHARALLVCALLLIAPWGLILFIWARDELWNPWLISVALFGMEVVIKTFVSLTVYGMFLWDTRRPNGLGDQLDEYIFWVRGFGAGLEFLCSILLLFNGVYILLFEQTGVLRSLMICVHAYCNIWMQASEGWNSFRRRRQAALRLDQLSDLIDSDTDEVCSICYVEIRENPGCAKVTACNHIFHRGCLKKWLYMHDRCPMCHRSVFTGLPQTDNR